MCPNVFVVYFWKLDCEIDFLDTGNSGTCMSTLSPGLKLHPSSGEEEANIQGVGSCHKVIL